MSFLVDYNYEIYWLFGIGNNRKTLLKDLMFATFGDNICNYSQNNN